MCKSNKYSNEPPKYFAVSANYNDFYNQLLQKVQNNWNRIGNDILGLSDSKVSRLLSGKQKDFGTLVMMAEFIGIELIFKAK